MRILHVGYGFRPFRHGGVILYAEDLMRWQVASGHDVAYFFPGRYQPLGRRNRLWRWSHDGIAMRELLRSTIIWGATGTVRPHDDLRHAPSETLFEEVLDEVGPELVHIHELVGLPSSLIDIARGRGLPVVASLQDYLPLCPVLKLYDADGRRCRRQHVGEQCRRCCLHSPRTPRWMIEATVRYEIQKRLPEQLAVPLIARLAQSAEVASRSRGLVRRTEPPPASEAEALEQLTPPARDYQTRREVNVERLSRLDALIVQSRRAAQIYVELGVSPETVRVMQFTLRHLERIAHRDIPVPTECVRFVTLNGCASVEKGSEVVIGAIEQLTAAGLDRRFDLTVLGWAPDETISRLDRFANVRYGGWYDSEDLDAVLAGYDVGIVPSVWEESYAYAGVELLAKGIPVIGSALGGIVDYTRDGETGWLNHDASAAGLATIMADIIARPDQVTELNAEIGRQRDRIIRRFADHANEVEAVYLEALERAASSVPGV